MPTNNFIVTSLPAYVENNRDVLLKNFGLVGTDTRRRIGLQTGIKKSAYLNYLEVSPTLQDASGCGMEPAGDVTLTQRTINVATIGIDLPVCAKKLLGKWAEYLVRVNASADTLPFEQFIMDGVTAEINKKIEKLIWQGDTSKTTDPNLKWIDGFLKQMGADSDVIDVAIAAGTSAFQGFLDVYNAMPEEVLERGGVIFASPTIYRIFVQELVALNFYHYSGPQDSYPEEFVLPGTDVRIIKTPGLAGSLQVVGTWAENLVYGTDFENDEEDIIVEYDKKKQIFDIIASWNSGVAYAFPNYIVLGEFASAPARPKFSADAIAAIAANTENIGTAVSTLASDEHVFKTKEQAE